MSHSFVCASCRVRLSLLKHVKPNVRQLRWQSRHISAKQDSLSDYRLNSIHDRQARRQSDQSSNRRGSQSVDNKLRGRYSGQILGPEELLQQLHTLPQDGQNLEERTQTEPANLSARLENRLKGPGNGGPPIRRTTRHRASRLQSSELPRPLWELRRKFRTASETPEDDEGIFIALEDVIKTYYGHADLQKLGHDDRFRIAYYLWTMRMCERWLQALRTEYVATLKTSCSPLEALTYWSRTGTVSRTVWPRILWLVARDVVELYASNVKNANAPTDCLIQGLRQLMGVWHLCMSTQLQRQNASEVSDNLHPLENTDASTAMSWAFLPDPATFAESLQVKAHQKETRMSLREALFLLVHSYSTTPSKSGHGEHKERQLWDYESAVLVTMSLLHSMKQRSGGEVVKPFEPWLTLMEATVKSATASKTPDALTQRMTQLEGGDARREYYQALIQNWKLKSAPIGDGITQERQGTKGAANDAAATSPTAIEESPNDLMQDPAVPTKNATLTDRFSYVSIKRLSRAVEQQDLKAVERVEKDVQRFTSQNPTIQLPQALYEHLIFAFLCLRSLPAGIEIWNHMITAGHRPTSKTFTVMMRGSQHLKDLTSINFFWDKMRQAKVQPDAQAWSTRVHGLLMKEQTDMGLRALFEMGQNWLDAAKTIYNKEHPSSKKTKDAPTIPPSTLLKRFEGDVDGVPRPDVIMMNSAISALARNQDHLIPKVLTWGRWFGIEPDRLTYNTLLNVSMRNGMADEAVNILQRMKDRNIEADSTTWTVLLAAMFEGRFLDGLEQKDQEAKVFEVISSLESVNSASIDEKGYALIIDRLLKYYDNPQAAQAVLSYMASRGVEPNVHMYTILMDSYFCRSPPNFTAAENLYTRIQSSKGGYGVALDAKFYNRLVEGYAAHHASVGTGPMLSFLSRMEQDGKQPSWHAMEYVARALSEAGEWERLAQIVDKTRRRLREDRGADTRHGQWEFWRFVISTGMLRYEGITSPEQIMGTPLDNPLSRVQRA